MQGDRRYRTAELFGADPQFTTELDKAWPARGRLRQGEAYSVTTALDVIAKPQLMYWAAKMERGFVPDQNDPRRYGFEVAQQAARGIGIDLHKAAEEHLLGSRPLFSGAPISAAPPEYPWRAWLEWHDRRKPEPISVERPVCHGELRYAGTVDLFAVVGGRPTVIDWKVGTGRAREAHIMQIAAYGEAIVSMARSGYEIYSDLGIESMDDIDLLVVLLPRDKETYDQLRTKKNNKPPYREERPGPSAKASAWRAFRGALELKMALDGVGKP